MLKLIFQAFFRESQTRLKVVIWEKVKLHLSRVGEKVKVEPHKDAHVLENKKGFLIQI